MKKKIIFVILSFQIKKRKSVKNNHKLNEISVKKYSKNMHKDIIIFNI